MRDVWEIVVKDVRQMPVLQRTGMFICLNGWMLLLPLLVLQFIQPESRDFWSTHRDMAYHLGYGGFLIQFISLATSSKRCGSRRKAPTSGIRP